MADTADLWRFIPALQQMAAPAILLLANSHGVMCRVQMCTGRREGPATVLAADPAGGLIPGNGLLEPADGRVACSSAPVVLAGEPVATVEVFGDPLRRSAATGAAAAIAMMVQVCLERLQAGQKLYSLEAELERYRKRALQSEEDLRKLVAMEVHDSLSQGAAFLYFQIQLFEDCLSGMPREVGRRFQKIRQLARTLVEDTSRLLLDLRPPHVETLGLVPALERYLESFTQQTGIPVHCSVTGAWHHLTDHRAVAIYRIVQEALHNAWKHAKASQLLVMLEASKDSFTLTVEDNGVGFDADGVLEDAPARFGLCSMRERAARCGGHLDIRSSPGLGCTVRFTMPLPQSLPRLSRR